jgi:serine/threonine protein kinase/tetratricopeptide (TPR) repeat protein
MPPIIQNHSILRSIGSGTHGTVYESIDPDGDRHAIKVFNESNVTSEKFQHLFDLSHPHILSPNLSGYTSDKSFFLRFPLVRQIDAEKKPVAGSPTSALSLLIQAASGLSYLHRKGHIHGDLKPANVLLEAGRTADEWQQINVLLSDLELVDVNPEGLHGTLGYMAPELLEGLNATPRADIFALGAWLYWVITGEEGFVGPNLSDSLALASNADRVLPVGRKRPDYSGPFWENLLRKMLASKPEARFADGQDLLHFVISNCSAVAGSTESIPKLLWNPVALTHSDQLLIGKLADCLQKHEAPTVVVLKAEHSIAPHEIIRRAFSRKSLVFDESLVVRMDQPLSTIMNSLLSGKPSIVIDNTNSTPRSPLTSVLDFCILNGFGRGDRHLVVISSELTDVLLDKGLNQVSVETEKIDQGEWLDELFSGIESDSELKREIGFATGTVLVNPHAVVPAIASACQSSLLSVDVNGKIAVDATAVRSFRGLMADAKRNRLVHLSQAALNYLSVLTCTAKELSVSLRRALLELLGARTERELLDAGLIEVVEGRSRSINPQAVFSSIGPIASSWNKLDISRLVEVASKHERIVLSSMMDQSSRTSLVKVLAYAEYLLDRGNAIASLCVLRNVVDATTTYSLDARWHYIQGKAWEAMDEIRLASEHMAESVESYQLYGQSILASRAAIYLARMYLGRSQREDYEKTRIRAEELIEHNRSQSANRFRTMLQAEASHSRRMRADYDKAEKDASEVLAGTLAHLRTRALAYKTIALTASKRGDGRRVRQMFACSLQAARRSGDKRMLAHVAASVAGYEFARGFYPKSRVIISQGIEKCAHKASFNDRYSGLNALGGIAFESGNIREAFRINMRALGMASSDQDEEKKAHASHNIALSLLEMNRLSESIQMAKAALANESRNPVYASNPRIVTAYVHVEIGAFSRADEVVRHLLDGEQAENSPFKLARIHRLTARMELLKGNAALARQHCQLAAENDRQTQARDEALITEALFLEADRLVGDRSQSLEGIRELERRAGELRNWRLERQFRVLRLSWDEGMEMGGRMAELERMIQECFQKGYAILEQPMLRLKAELLIGAGWYVEAQDVLREALGRIKAVSSGFTDPELRRIYLADPRRQRFLELVRLARPR